MAKKRHPQPADVDGGTDPVVVDSWSANRPYRDDELPARETRGDKKRRAEQLERLGESLIDLPEVKLARVPMPNDLAAAVREARRIRNNTSARGGYRRQIQFIGRIMRSLDAVPIAEALETMKREDAPSSAAFSRAERWRDRLVTGDDSDLDVLLTELPALDRTEARQLMRQAQKEAREGKPPHAARALFRLLRPLLL
jgi:ribosome-associated protein